jgi:hypothetical protein
MGGVPTEASAVEHFYPVFVIILFVLGTLVVTVGGLWGGFRWLRGVIQTEFTGLIKEFIAANDKRHEKHEAAIEGLRRRDMERADAIKRLHGRVDDVWSKMGGTR